MTPGIGVRLGERHVSGGIALRRFHRLSYLFMTSVAIAGAVALGGCETDDVATVLAQIGMNDPLRANGGFFRAASAEVVRALPEMLRRSSSPREWARAVELLKVQQSRRDRFGREITVAALRFAELSGEMARACLAPWLPGGGGTSVPREEIWKCHGASLHSQLCS